MDNPCQVHGNCATNARGFLAGLLIGGLVGAGAMLVLAPRSGKKTRAQIQRKGLELRNQASEGVEDAMAQARVKARQTTDDVREKAKELEQRGQAIVDQQKERFAPA